MLEQKTYDNELSKWLKEGRAGQFVAIKENKILGFDQDKATYLKMAKFLELSLNLL